jgi:ankyrin repeat protein
MVFPSETALHTAAEYNHHEVARLLLQQDPMLVNLLR